MVTWIVTTWHHFGNAWAQLEDHLEQVGDDFGTTWGKTNLEQLWDNFGTALRKLWDNFDTTFGPHGDYLISIGGASLCPVCRKWPLSWSSCHKCIISAWIRNDDEKAFFGCAKMHPHSIYVICIYKKKFNSANATLMFILWDFQKEKCVKLRRLSSTLHLLDTSVKAA